MRDLLKSRISELMHRLATGDRDDDARDALLVELATWQSHAVEPYSRFCGGIPLEGRRLDDIPALPTDVFRFARVAAHSEDLDQRRFHTSGTTLRDEHGTHAFRDLDLYDLAARLAARHCLFPDRDRMTLIILAPSEREAPHSSLSYMLSRFSEWFATDTHWIWKNDALDHERLRETLIEAHAVESAVALLGTSFALVHALDALPTNVALPAGSRIMQTGGFKGRSRTIEPDEMIALLSHRFGVPAPMVIAEYGMTELSSQMYETTLRDAVLGRPIGRRRLWHPGWMRVTPIAPITSLPGDAGVLRIDDLANLDSCAVLQTADLGDRVLDGIRVRGRSREAVERGCSIGADLALSRIRDV